MYAVPIGGAPINTAQISIDTTITSGNVSCTNISGTNATFNSLETVTFNPQTIDTNFIYTDNLSVVNSITELNVQTLNVSNISSANVQEKLIAGDNISILNNVISAVNDALLPSNANFSSISTDNISATNISCTTITADNLSTNDMEIISPLTYDSNTKQLSIPVDTTPTSGSQNLITSDAVYQISQDVNLPSLNHSQFYRQGLTGHTMTIQNSSLSAGTSGYLLYFDYYPKFQNSLINVNIHLSYNVGGHGTDDIDFQLQVGKNNNTTTTTEQDMNQKWVANTGGGTRSGSGSIVSAVYEQTDTLTTGLYHRIKLYLQNNGDDTFTLLDSSTYTSASVFETLETDVNSNTNLYLGNGTIDCASISPDSMNIQALSGFGFTMGFTDSGVATESKFTMAGAGTFLKYMEHNWNGTDYNLSARSSGSAFRFSSGQVPLLQVNETNTCVKALQVDGDLNVSGNINGNVSIANLVTDDVICETLLVNDLATMSDMDINGDVDIGDLYTLSSHNNSFNNVSINNLSVTNITSPNLSTASLIAGNNIEISNNTITAYLQGGIEFNASSIHCDNDVNVFGNLNVSETSSFENSLNVKNQLYVGDAGNTRGQIVVYSDIIGDNLEIENQDGSVNFNGVGAITDFNFSVGGNRSLQITADGVNISGALGFTGDFIADEFSSQEFRILDSFNNSQYTTITRNNQNTNFSSNSSLVDYLFYHGNTASLTISRDNITTARQLNVQTTLGTNNLEVDNIADINGLNVCSLVSNNALLTTVNTSTLNASTINIDIVDFPTINSSTINSCQTSGEELRILDSFNNSFYAMINRNNQNVNFSSNSSLVDYLFYHGNTASLTISRDNITTARQLNVQTTLGTNNIQIDNNASVDGTLTVNNLDATNLSTTNLYVDIDILCNEEIDCQTIVATDGRIFRLNTSRANVSTLNVSTINSSETSGIELRVLDSFNASHYATINRNNQNVNFSSNTSLIDYYFYHGNTASLAVTRDLITTARQLNCQTTLGTNNLQVDNNASVDGTLSASTINASEINGSNLSTASIQFSSQFQFALNTLTLTSSPEDIESATLASIANNLNSSTGNFSNIISDFGRIAGAFTINQANICNLNVCNVSVENDIDVNGTLDCLDLLATDATITNLSTTSVSTSILNATSGTITNLSSTTCNSSVVSTSTLNVSNNINTRFMNASFENTCTGNFSFINSSNMNTCNFYATLLQANDFNIQSGNFSNISSSVECEFNVVEFVSLRGNPDEPNNLSVDSVSVEIADIETIKSININSTNVNGSNGNFSNLTATNFGLTSINVSNGDIRNLSNENFSGRNVCCQNLSASQFISCLVITADDVEGQLVICDNVSSSQAAEFNNLSFINMFSSNQTSNFSCTNISAVVNARILNINGSTNNTSVGNFSNIITDFGNINQANISNLNVCNVSVENDIDLNGTLDCLDLLATDATITNLSATNISVGTRGSIGNIQAGSTAFGHNSHFNTCAVAIHQFSGGSVHVNCAETASVLIRSNAVEIASFNTTDVSLFYPLKANTGNFSTLNVSNLNATLAISDITNLQSQLDSKQNTLTAGSNITIVNDVISATGVDENISVTNISVSNEVSSSIVKATTTNSNNGNFSTLNVSTLNATLGISDITNLQTELDSKQDNLTAGANISILNNVISATGVPENISVTNISASNEIETLILTSDDIISSDINTTNLSSTNASITNLSSTNGNFSVLNTSTLNVSNNVTARFMNASFENTCTGNFSFINSSNMNTCNFFATVLLADSFNVQNGNFSNISSSVECNFSVVEFVSLIGNPDEPNNLSVDNISVEIGDIGTIKSINLNSTNVNGSFGNFSNLTATNFTLSSLNLSNISNQNFSGKFVSCQNLSASQFISCLVITADDVEGQLVICDNVSSSQAAEFNNLSFVNMFSKNQTSNFSCNNISAVVNARILNINGSTNNTSVGNFSTLNVSTLNTTLAISAITNLQTELDSKQNVLTAGTGITIINDVISSTGGSIPQNLSVSNLSVTDFLSAGSNGYLGNIQGGSTAFGHKNHFTANSVGIHQFSGGSTHLNCGSGNSVLIRSNAVQIASFNTTSIDLSYPLNISIANFSTINVSNFSLSNGTITNFSNDNFSGINISCQDITTSQFISCLALDTPTINNTSIDTLNVSCENISTQKNQGYDVITCVACAKVNANGTLQRGKNVTISRPSTGIYNVSFITALPTADYCVQITSVEESSVRDDVICHVVSGTPSTTGFQFMVHEQDNSTSPGTYRDRNSFVCVFL